MLSDLYGHVHILETFQVFSKNCEVRTVNRLQPNTNRNAAAAQSSSLIVHLCFIICCCAPSFLSCPDQLTFKLLQAAGARDRSAGASISQLRSNYCSNEGCFIQSCSGWLSPQKHHQLCSIRQQSFAAWNRFLWFHAALRLWFRKPVGLVCEPLHLICFRFVTRHVSVPFPAVLCFVEAAPGHVVFCGELHTQELALRQDHQQQQLHRRRESSSAKRARPVVGHCTRGGSLLFLFILWVAKVISFQHLELYLKVFAPIL